MLKAELVLPVEESFFDKPIPAQDQLFVLMEGASGGFVQTPDQDAPISVGKKRHLLSPYHFQEVELEKLQLDIDK